MAARLPRPSVAAEPGSSSPHRTGRMRRTRAATRCPGRRPVPLGTTVSTDEAAVEGVVAGGVREIGRLDGCFPPPAQRPQSATAPSTTVSRTPGTGPSAHMTTSYWSTRGPQGALLRTTTPRRPRGRYLLTCSVILGFPTAPRTLRPSYARPSRSGRDGAHDRRLQAPAGSGSMNRAVAGRHADVRRGQGNDAIEPKRARAAHDGHS